MKFFLVFSSIFIAQVLGGWKKSEWEPVCGEDPQEDLKSEWKTLSKNIETSYTQRKFWTDKNMGLIIERVNIIKGKIPVIYESVIASIDDKFREYKIAEDKKFKVIENEYSDDQTKTVWCKTYLTLLSEYVEENHRILNSAMTAALKKRKSEKIRFLKAKILNDSAKQDLTEYESRLAKVIESNGLEVKTNGETGASPFAKIDQNDIKRVKWGVGEDQIYPASVKNPRMNEEEFRSYIRAAANYWMCVAHVVLEETPPGTAEDENHIFFKFGKKHVPEVVRDVPKTNDTGIAVSVKMCPMNGEYNFNETDSSGQRVPVRDFPYYRQKDMSLTQQGWSQAHAKGEDVKGQGICGNNIYINDVLKNSELNANEENTKLMDSIASGIEWRRKDIKGFKNGDPVTRSRIVIHDPLDISGQTVEPDLAFIIAHEMGHALGLDHRHQNNMNLMFWTPTQYNTGVFKDFLEQKQMTMQKCEEERSRFPAADQLSASALFLKSLKLMKEKVPKTVRAQKDCPVPNPCKCGFDGLKNCQAKTKKPAIPINRQAILDEIKGVDTTTSIDASTEPPKSTEAPESTETTTEKILIKKRVKDGMKCELKVAALKTRGFTSPDIYYVLKVNDETVKDSENAVKPNRITANWNVDFNEKERSAYFEGYNNLKIEFWDDDSWTGDDLIGKVDFDVKDNAKFLPLTGGDKKRFGSGYKYRSEESSAKFDCEVLFKNE